MHICQILPVSLQTSNFGKFPLSQKFRVDISECHAITIANKEKVKTILNK